MNINKWLFYCLIAVAVFAAYRVYAYDYNVRMIIDDLSVPV